MTNIERFSKRQGLFALKEKEITIREGAPEGLRGYIKIAYYDLNKNPSKTKQNFWNLSL